MPANSWAGAPVKSSRLLADTTTLRVGKIRIRVVNVAPDSCEINSKMAQKIAVKDCFAP